MIIKLKDIAKVQRLYVEIFEEEDDDFVDHRKIRPKEMAIDRILNKITPNEEDQKKIYNIICVQSWNQDDNTYKPICDELRKLNYIIEEGK